MFSADGYLGARHIGFGSNAAQSIGSLSAEAKNNYKNLMDKEYPWGDNFSLWAAKDRADERIKRELEGYGELLLFGLGKPVTLADKLQIEVDEILLGWDK